MLRILGIDPGSRITGYSVIDSNGIRSTARTYGALRLQGEEHPARLGQIFAGVRGLIAEHEPQVAAIEQVFMAKNPSSALKLGQARGAAICAAVDGGLEVVEYSATRVKQAVVGNGHAEKGQIQHMVQMILGLEKRPQADAADALAVALCHAHTGTSLLRQTNTRDRSGR